MQKNSHGTSGLGRKISKLVTVSVLSAMFILAIILMLSQVQDSISSKHKNLDSVGYVFAAAMADSIESQNRGEIQKVLRSIARLPDILHAVAVNNSGKSIASMGNATFLDSDLINNESGLWQMLTKGNMPVSVDIIRGGATVGKLVLIADISDIRQSILRTLLTTIIASLIASAMAAPISRPLQRKITGPIIKLTSTIQKLRETRSFQPAEVTGAEGETKVLVDAFNGMIVDIHDRDNALQQLAYFDPLTGLPNRVNFHKILNTMLAIDESKPRQKAAIFLMDIDNFHAINDALGHSIGDALLMNIAALFNEEATENVTVARIGGDEFAIVIPGVETTQAAEEQLARFIATLYQPIDLLGHALHITASVGALLIPKDGSNMGEVQRHLDLALHAAKQSGAGRVYFYNPELSENIKEEAELAQGLRTALANNQLDVHFQPIVSLATGKTDGFEALARWNHPIKGTIPPSKFIPVAEKSGQISMLGDWVLRASCKQAKAWIDMGLPPRFVAVNISAAQMLQAGFIEKVRRALNDTELPANLLCLELTESLFVGKSMNTVQKLLLELKQIGIRTALDDFGTGYSSLSYLEHLPFDKLKIDRAFVKNLHTGKKNVDLLHGIIELAHALGMTVVAEGAETLEQLEILIDLNADCVQGYVYAKPAPAAEAAKRAADIDLVAEVAKEEELAEG